MANEIQVTYDTGNTLYALIFNATGQVWDVGADDWTTYAAGSIADYDIALSEIATNSGQYRGAWPNHPRMTAGISSIVALLSFGCL